VSAGPPELNLHPELWGKHCLDMNLGRNKHIKTPPFPSHTYAYSPGFHVMHGRPPNEEHTW
jgi:hypothetical protein